MNRSTNWFCACLAAGLSSLAESCDVLYSSVVPSFCSLLLVHMAGTALLYVVRLAYRCNMLCGSGAISHIRNDGKNFAIPIPKTQRFEWENGVQAP